MVLLLYMSSFRERNQQKCTRIVYFKRLVTIFDHNFKILTKHNEINKKKKKLLNYIDKII